ncbi:hypothetical protein Gorai_000568 [Gossypium raimondii]|uniref:Endonuclease/exonuclease/phosphatase domain-containing protein n=1 Tax=Gossypium raimondii TaxID=29730 RepID=A0A7J8PDT2_GOSRA|nr:hypothetical protein [Gossypium raimondii]
MEVGILLNEGVLDPLKHSAVKFRKENLQPKITFEIDGGNSEGGGFGILGVKGRRASEKIGVGRGGKKLNNSLRGCGSHFKMFGNLIVPLSDSINSTVDLIASHLEIETGFQRSHRVEDIGYFRGIWIGWKDLIRVEVEKLHDLRFRGPFTWHRGGVFERSDHAPSNDAWMRDFPNSLATHILQIKSDHRPLLLSVSPKLDLLRGKPFHFLA